MLSSSHPHPLLNADLSFNRRAIMAEAARSCRGQVSGPLLPGFAPTTYREAFPANLRLVWAFAKAARAEALLTPEASARLADRRAALFGADMIDETARSFAARAAILAQSEART
jgi:hypothetical protein